MLSEVTESLTDRNRVKVPTPPRPRPDSFYKKYDPRAQVLNHQTGKIMLPRSTYRFFDNVRIDDSTGLLTSDENRYTSS